MRAETINYGLNEKEIFSSVRAFLSQYCNGAIINGNQSSPMPTDCIVITMLNRKSRSLTSTVYDKDTGKETARRSQFAIFQVDIYGVDAGIVYDAIVTLSLNPTSYDNQKQQSPNIELVTINERGRLPFINEQQNYENRYTLEMEFSIYNEISRTIDFIESINVKTIEVK